MGHAHTSVLLLHRPVLPFQPRLEDPCPRREDHPLPDHHRPAPRSLVTRQTENVTWRFRLVCVIRPSASPQPGRPGSHSFSHLAQQTKSMRSHKHRWRLLAGRALRGAGREALSLMEARSAGVVGGGPPSSSWKDGQTQRAGVRGVVETFRDSSRKAALHNASWPWSCPGGGHRPHSWQWGRGLGDLSGGHGPRLLAGGGKGAKASGLSPSVLVHSTDTRVHAYCVHTGVPGSGGTQEARQTPVPALLGLVLRWRGQMVRGL